MRRDRRVVFPFVVALLASGCSSGTSDPVAGDAATSDATTSDAVVDSTPTSDSAAVEIGEAGVDETGAACSVSGVSGTCITVTACAALGTYTSTPGLCPGPADIQCCAETPSVASNPPTPDGYTLMSQAAVTADMTTWAVAILHDPVTYPMFSTTTKTFGTQLVLARVEWHPPDFLNSAVHRGVTLYVPI